MTVTPSLSAAGLTVLRVEDVRERLVAAIQASPEWGPDTPVGPESPIGQIIDAQATEIGAAWELLQAVYDSQVPDAAEGVCLDNIASITLLRREDETYSTVTLTLSGVAATVIAAGKRVRVADGPIFALDDDATIGGGGTVTGVLATCTEAGANEASAGSVVVIVDAVTGWTGVTNPADAVSGQDIETDELLRERREESLSLSGSSTDPAIRARLAALDCVDAAVVISNRSTVTDSYGHEPHSMGIYLWPDGGGADDEEIADAIYGQCGPPAGIKMMGTETATVTDDQGYETTVAWYYASEYVVDWQITITTEDDYPAGGDDLIKAAVVAYGATLSVGDDVLPDACEAAIWGAVAGLRTCTASVREHGTMVWYTTPITIAMNQIATTAIGNVTVV